MVTSVVRAFAFLPVACRALAPARVRPPSAETLWRRTAPVDDLWPTCRRCTCGRYGSIAL